MTNVTDADGQDEGARESAAAPEPAASAVSGDAPQAAAGESASSPEAGSGAASPAAASGVTAVFGIDWDALAALLATAASAASASPLPPYRRIWFQSLIRQGREAESQGRAALAAHCFARLEQ